jgi:hypothetical protein
LMPTQSAARRFLFSSLFYPHAPSALELVSASVFSHAAEGVEFDGIKAADSFPQVKFS